MARKATKFGFTPKGLMTQIKKQKGDIEAICKALKITKVILKNARKEPSFRDCDHALKVAELVSGGTVGIREANRTVWKARVLAAMANANNKRTDAAKELGVSLPALCTIIKRDPELLAEFGVGIPGGVPAQRVNAKKNKVLNGANESVAN